MKNLVLVELPGGAPVGERASLVVPRFCPPLSKNPRAGAPPGRDAQISPAKNARAIAMSRLD